MRKTIKLLFLLCLAFASQTSFANTKIFVNIRMNQPQDAQLDTGLSKEKIMGVVSTNLQSRGYEIVNSKNNATHNLTLQIDISSGGQIRSRVTSAYYSLAISVWSTGTSAYANIDTVALGTSDGGGFFSGESRYVRSKITEQVNKAIDDYLSENFR